jgi:4-carboxymuconolactone decarboxylase
MIKDESFDRGREIRSAMWGSDATDAQVDTTRELNDKLQEIVTRWCFGDLWSREELPLRVRSMITVSMLLALGREHELEIHMVGALANGVTDVELREICLHAVAYCGIPSAGEGLRTLDKVLAARLPDSTLLRPAIADD